MKLPSVVRLERHTRENCSSRRIRRLVPVFILETHNQTNNWIRCFLCVLKNGQLDVFQGKSCILYCGRRETTERGDSTSRSSLFINRSIPLINQTNRNSEKFHICWTLTSLSGSLLQNESALVSFSKMEPSPASILELSSASIPEPPSASIPLSASIPEPPSASIPELPSASILEPSSAGML